MRVQCGWCKQWLSEKAPFHDKSISHTICPGCTEKLLAMYTPQGDLKSTLKKLKEAS